MKSPNLLANLIQFTLASIMAGIALTVSLLMLQINAQKVQAASSIQPLAAPCSTPVVTLTAVQDTWIDESDPNQNWYIDWLLNTKPAAGDLSRALIQFDLSSIPANSTINCATLRVYEWNQDTDQTIYVHRVTSSWNSPEATWLDRKTGISWTATGGDYDSSEVASFAADTALAYQDINVTSLVQFWVDNPGSNFGTLFRSTTTSSTLAVVFVSRQGLNKPELVVDFVTADMELSKVVTPSLVAPGQTLTYTLTYTNHGPSVATGVVITDIVPITLTDIGYTSSGAQITPSGSLSYTWGVADLAVGAGGIITITGVVSSDLTSDTSFTNKVTITTTIVDTDTTNNSDQAATTVTLPRVSFSSATYNVDEGAGPAIITATLDTAPFVTATVSYTSSDGTATTGPSGDYTAISDTLTFPPATTSLTFTVPITDDALHEPNETVLLSLSTPTQAVLETPTTAILTITDNDPGFTPVLTITKDGPSTASVGSSVSYTFTVKHDVTSDGSLVSNLSLNDSVAGPATLTGGDTNANSQLDASEIWTYTVNYTTKPTDPNPLVNIGTVSGKDSDGDDIIATASHSTALTGFEPQLWMDQDGPITATVGDTVTFTYIVLNINLGDGSSISNITVTDNVAGAATYTGGDYNGNGKLDKNEAWYYRATYTVQALNPNPLVNTAIAQGKDQEGDTITSNNGLHSTTIDFLVSTRLLFPIIFKNY